MYLVCKEIEFCYGHRLYQDPGPCGHLHGHNGRVELVLAAPELGAQDMVFEFAALKERIQAQVAAKLDHKMLLKADDPLAAQLQEMGEPLYLMKQNPTAEVIAREIFYFARAEDLPVVEVRLWESSRSWASYRE